MVRGTGFLTWLNTDMTEEGRSHCCGPRWGGGKQACANATAGDQICGSCCVADANYTGNSVPCDPLLPVIPESHNDEGPSYGPRDAHTSDPTEHVSDQMIGPAPHRAAPHRARARAEAPCTAV